MAIVCPQRYYSSFASHQTTHHVGIMYSFSKLDYKLFFTFTPGLPIIWRAIQLHLSNPRRTKAKVSSSPVTTPHSLFQTFVQSLYHLVMAMFFISMMLCCFLKLVSQKKFVGWTIFFMITKAMPSLLRLPLCCQGSTQVLVCDCLHFVWQNHFYVMLPFYQGWCLFQSLLFKNMLQEVQRRFCADSKSEKSDPKILSRRSSHAFGRPSVSRSFE
jgi:hypothetical protein